MGDVFGLVADEAKPFLVACLSRLHPGRVWVLCDSVRNQEDFAAELSAWLPGTRFFPGEAAINPEVLPDPEVAAERLDILRSLAKGEKTGPLVLHHSQLDEDVPGAGVLDNAVISFKKGGRVDLDDVISKLEAAGYERNAQTAVRGHFSLRGGILDIFSWQASAPVRIELDDDLLDSIRSFEPDSQISFATLDSCEILTGKLEGPRKPLRQILGKKDLIIDTSGQLDLAGAVALEGANEREGDESEFLPLPFGEFAAGDLVLDATKATRFFAQLEEWRSRKWTIVLAASSQSEADRFAELAGEHGFDAQAVRFLHAALGRSFIFPAAKLAILADAHLFGRLGVLRARRLSYRREKLVASRVSADFSEFLPGDFVVHLEHGIGKFIGLEPAPDDADSQVLVIEYADQSRLYVPLDQAWQVSRYAGLGVKNPVLSTLGDGRWEKAKIKARQSIFDYASRMLKVQAERETLVGHPFPPDTHWQAEFEGSFPYSATPDQMRAIDDSKRDMESTRPMDRLICGDVGFGKTEVAIRSVFKAVMGGKQVGFLAPTTVLAQQHYETLRERMSDYPVVVELLSRYRTAADQKKVLSRLAKGEVDVVVGTHRLVSADVQFKNLGLVVVDEEQRFGVKHKELLKERFRQVDVLTLSATPIPRTLYLALMGARDMSLIETPPTNRQPVETVVCAYDERVFRDAINRELARGGQVYFLHNRVKTITSVAARIRELCPKARVAVGHGQMEEKELEGIMRTFVSGQADILVSTTIIESGLDIPNANTIIIDRADLFGLADLYQLRGRVGRSQAKAYAYLMLPRDLMGAARKRVSAIKQYSELGSGFKIAMRDLELRGAGNLLGTAQSGHIIAVGFDLYCKMLRRAVDTVAGKVRFTRAECAIRLDFIETSEAAWKQAASNIAPAFIPSSYVGDPRSLIACHRKLAELEERTGLENLEREWRDRFGPLPPAVQNALLVAAIRIEAAQRRISSVEAKEGKLMLTRKGDFIQVAGRFPRLTASAPDFRLREVLEIVSSLSRS